MFAGERDYGTKTQAGKAEAGNLKAVHTSYLTMKALHFDTSTNYSE